MTTLLIFLDICALFLQVPLHDCTEKEVMQVEYDDDLQSLVPKMISEKANPVLGEGMNCFPHSSSRGRQVLLTTFHRHSGWWHLLIFVSILCSYQYIKEGNITTHNIV